jgi:hypothetical protein
MGYCGGYNQPSFASPVPGFRCEFGFGGRGWRHRLYATGVPGWVTTTLEQETTDLKAEADMLKGQLDAIQKRIEELTSK